MSRLNEVEVSFDSDVACDFCITRSIPLLESLLPGRIVLSDFVQEQLHCAGVSFTCARVIELKSEEHLDLLDELRRHNPRLGLAELGAITVAQIRCAVLASNDACIREAAEGVGLNVSNSLEIVLEAVDCGLIKRSKADEKIGEMKAAGASFPLKLLESFRTRVAVENPAIPRA